MQFTKLFPPINYSIFILTQNNNDDHHQFNLFTQIKKKYLSDKKQIHQFFLNLFRRMFIYDHIEMIFKPNNNNKMI